ncbi:MAG: hypothetical protein ACK5O2_00885 [Microthrixaceae bacterium]
MAPALMTAPSAGRCPSVPRRSLGLMTALVSHICDTPSLPEVPVVELAPVRSMFDYDPQDATPLRVVPRIPR